MCSGLAIASPTTTSATIAVGVASPRVALTTTALVASPRRWSCVGWSSGWEPWSVVIRREREVGVVATLLRAGRTIVVASSTGERHAVCERSSTAAAATTAARAI